MWTDQQIKALRLAELAAIRRLIGATAAPVNTPSEWIGWQVIVPDAETRRYLQRAARGLCTRCGAPPRPGRKTCEPCAVAAAARSAALRARRKAAGACQDCGRPATGGNTRCEGCQVNYRPGGRWPGTDSRRAAC